MVAVKKRSSSLRRKQHKRLYNAPLHVKQKLVSSHLSKELSEKAGRRAVPLRKGDKVKIMRGSRKGTVAKVEEVDLLRQRAYLEGISVSKVNGAKARVPIHPSNLLIIELNLSDKRRLAEVAALPEATEKKIARETATKKE
ncbi:MAG: 50S ribosomal protein L24 [archaeon]